MFVLYVLTVKYRLHSFHPYYYMINGINKDGFAYVLYINGGHQQWMILYPFKQKITFECIHVQLIKYYYDFTRLCKNIFFISIF